MTQDTLEHNSAIAEVASPEVSPETAVQKEETPPIDDRQDRNWKELRRKAEEAERRAKMNEELVERLLQQHNQQVPQQPIVKDEFDEIPDEEYVNKKTVQRIVDKKAEEKARKIAQEEVKRLLAEQEKAQFIPRLKSEFSDFDQVVNAETLDLLKETKPKLYNILERATDPYEAYYQAYENIKALNLQEKIPSARRSKEVDKKIEENKKTVQSPQSYEKRPMAEVFKMTDQMKNELFKEMMGYASLAGGVQPL